MTSVLRDALASLIAAQPEMRLLPHPDGAEDVLALLHRLRPDVLIVQGEAPQPLALLAASTPLSLLVIGDDGRAGTLLRITSSIETVASLSSGRAFLDALCAARPERRH